MRDRSQEEPTGVQKMFTPGTTSNAAWTQVVAPGPASNPERAGLLLLSDYVELEPLEPLEPFKNVRNPLSWMTSRGIPPDAQSTTALAKSLSSPLDLLEEPSPGISP